MNKEKKPNFDLELITVREYRELFESDISTNRQDEIMVKCCTNYTLEELEELSLRGWQRFVKAFYDAVRNKDTDPN